MKIKEIATKTEEVNSDEELLDEGKWERKSKAEVTQKGMKQHEGYNESGKNIDNENRLNQMSQ